MDPAVTIEINADGIVLTTPILLLPKTTAALASSISAPTGANVAPISEE